MAVARFRNPIRTVFGLLIWVLIAVALSVWIVRAHAGRTERDARLMSHLWQYVFEPRVVVTIRYDNRMGMVVGAPIYWIDGSERVRQVGEVRRLLPATTDQTSNRPNMRSAEALFYPTGSPLNAKSSLTFYRTPRSISWVLRTMLPPRKRQEIREEISRAYQEYHTEVFDAIRPVVVSSLADAMDVLWQDFGAAIERHRDELETLGDRYEEQVFRQEVLPMVQREIWPAVKQHAEPLANKIGLEIWQRASLWRFGWRYVYDHSPLPDKNLAGTEWERFVRDEIKPVLTSHTDDIVAIQQQIVASISSNTNVRRSLHRNLVKIADDPAFQEIVRKIVRDVLIDNPKLHETLRRRWQSEEGQRAVEFVASRVEASVRRIGDLLLGTRESGITPEFAQVLRNQILDKDRCWLVIDAGPDVQRSQQDSSGMDLAVRWGGEPEINPFAVQLQGNR